MKIFIQNLWKKIKCIWGKINKRYAIIFVMTVAIFAPYISGKFILGDDYITHMSNLIAIDEYLSVSDGVFFLSKIRPILANDLGYGNGIFYPQLSYYVTEIIYIIIKQLGFSMITAFKIYEFLIMFLSGIFMYKFMNITFKNKNVALVSAIMYISMPYFCSDIFNRTAYSEINMFLFIPIVMMSITHIINQDYQKFMKYFIIGYCGMIFSHLVLTFYFTLFLIIILLINIKYILNKKSIYIFILSTVIVLGITSPFYVPLLEHMIKGNYVIFQEGNVWNYISFQKYTVSIIQLITRTANYSYSVYTFMNIVVLIASVITIVFYRKIVRNKKQKLMTISIFVITMISILLMSKIIDWTKMPKILCNIQFQWRFSIYVAFGMSTIAGLSIKIFKKKQRKIVLIIVFIICLIDARYAMSSCYELRDYEEIEMNTEMASVFGRPMGYQQEYLTVNAKNNKEYLKNRDQSILLVEGEADVEIIENYTPYLEFKVNIEDYEKVKVEIPRIFYFGYEIKCITDSGEEIELEYYENENGLIEFEINESGTIVIDYTGTTLNKIANIISATIVLILLLKKIREIYKK